MLTLAKPYWPRVFRQIRALLAFDLLFAAGVAIAFKAGLLGATPLPALPVSLMGAALGIVLGFRTNSAYDRWWEARTLWGGLVNSSRTLARQILSFTADQEFARETVLRQIAFVHGLRRHLRGEDPIAELQGRLPAQVVDALRKERNVPAALLHEAGQRLMAHANAGHLTEWRLQRLDETLTDLTNIQGGCERIKNTPLPRQYDYFPEMFIYLYCLLFPLSIVQDMGFLTPLFSGIITFVFLILNMIGKNLEDPFDDPVYGTPLSALSTTIEINLLQQLGETNLPAAMQPEQGVLS